MGRLRIATRVLTVIWVMTLFLSSFLCVAQAQSEIDQIVILYDASHTPQFDADDETLGLKLLFDSVNDSTRYVLRVHDFGPLNDTILNDVDILLIASPDKTYEYEINESLAITEMLTNGSSLLVLGDPRIDQDSSYWSSEAFRDLGENIALNNLLDSLNITGVRFSTNITEDGDIWEDTMFDFDHALNESHPSIIKLDSTTWNPNHPIFKDINELVIMTATLKPIDFPAMVATGYDTSFAQFRRGPNTFPNITYPNMSLSEFAEHPFSYSAINGTFPPWLAAFEYNESRVIISGSTLMFTGRNLDIPSSDDQWFYQADNSRFFMNMLSWLSEKFIESPSAIIPMLIISSAVFALGIVLYVVKKIR
jgi:hypothetical protein